MQMESGAASPSHSSEARGVAMHGRATAIALLVVVVIAPALVWAQFRGPRAVASRRIGSSPGATRAALEVRLPPQLHVQSNAPRPR